jgi:hypothetical protein
MPFKFREPEGLLGLFAIELLGVFFHGLVSRRAAQGSDEGRCVILVVEDDIPVRSVTAEFFRIAGYDVVQAGNTVEAIEVFTGERLSIFSSATSIL